MRDDLRVVHACWDDALVARLPSGATATEAHAGFESELRADFAARDVYVRAMDERAQFRGLTDPDARPDRVLPTHDEFVVAQHRGNPVRAMTSGLEHVVDPDQYIFLGGKWRTTMRSRWWEDYVGSQSVVVGHYWRARGRSDRGWHDIWGDVQTTAWAGVRSNVFCLDYCAGRRYRERWEGRTPEGGFRGALTAMRWPERLLVHDDREDPIPTVGWGAAEN